MKKYLALLLVAFSCQQKEAAPPAPVQPVPSERQLAWQDLEFYAFVHFNMNTFSNMEWGMGDEDPKTFNPTALDCRQWAKVAKDAGMKGIIITAKHHDGFCLWPTATTGHSVKNSSWKDGKGDVIKELSEACKEYGLKFGVYLSPWDRNNPHYGTPEYIDIFRTQLRELLTNYGEVFEVWFDGANGGTGYYGGANEERRVDKRNYYDWENTYSIIRELQPNAVIFSDGGPDIRWVGNEEGHAYKTTWSNLKRDEVYGGMPEYASEYSAGQEDGTHWVPAEVDVSIRPGWYYHPYEDHKVKSLPKLLDIYYESLGRNGSLLLNFPVDRRGLIHEKDAEQVQKLADKIKEDFAHNLASEKGEIAASETRGKGYGAAMAMDDDESTYWATTDGTVSGTLTVTFDKPTTFNRFLAQEYIALGQRVKAFTVEVETESGWEEIASETTIGYKRILRFPDVTATSVRFSVTDAKACPTISEIGIFNAPKVVMAPEISRSVSGMVSLEAADQGVDIYFTTDGSTPGKDSKKYESPFEVITPKTVQAIVIDQASGKTSEVGRVDFDLAKANWKVINGADKADQAIDENLHTNYTSKNNEVVIDLGAAVDLKGFTYMPMQSRYMSGVIQQYEFAISTDGGNWKTVRKGEFGNIAASPIEQKITFGTENAKFIRLKASKTLDGKEASFAEIGVITK
ncbi:alpha-L-fucosidase [Echinicola soli]|uniref:alpha-L-fucosidase n=1 Tax=Echinicola soli TaxID=2591634 RepID=A0A514CFH1_9BACT|nr:alpha-L-fucosidase [Echinicola soli]QDH78510.1 alpha-L-fucosidase [Echinicola soli]